MQHRKIRLDRGRGYHQEAAYHAGHKRNFSIFNREKKKKKKVALAIQVFVGTKTGWFRGFCSYYVEKEEDEGKICSGNERGKGMSWHTRRFSTILLYVQHIPPF
jgi:sulfite reductase alpha subunit-like flavoprotein